MLDHVSLAVRELARAASFYDAALAPLGYHRVWSYPDAVGYGTVPGQDKLALKTRDHDQRPGAGFHLAFTAASPAAVDAFFAAALAAGGSDNGPAGPRPQYGPHYYAAFVIDPDGYRLEAVCHTA